MKSDIRGQNWPKFIVAGIALHMLAMVTVILIATRDPSFAVEPEHYRKALAWDQTALQQQVSQALGWTVTLQSHPQLDPLGQRKIDLRILDRAGQPVHDAQIRVLAFAHARATLRLETVLWEEAKGHYTGHLAMRRAGLWECRIHVRKNPMVFSTTVFHTVKGEP